MRIARVDVFGYDLTYVHGHYVMSGGRVVESLPSTVVRVTTESGTEGFGEVCPLGPAYLPSHADGVRAALSVLVPAVVVTFSRTVVPRAAKAAASISPAKGLVLGIRRGPR